MPEYKISPDGFKEIRKQMLLKGVPLMLIAAAAGLFITTKNDANAPTVYPITIPMLALMLVYAFYRVISRQKVLYQSYTLTIGDNQIKREQLNTPAIAFNFTDVQSIKKQKNESFIVAAKNGNGKIVIPAQIDNYAGLEIALNSITPVETANTAVLKKYQGVFSLVLVGLMVCVFTVTNKLIVAFSGAVVIVVLIWGFIDIRNNKNINSKTKRGAWYFLLVLISVAVIVYYKLTR